VLLGPDTQTEPIELPDAEDLTAAQWRDMRQSVVSATSAWPHAGLMTMRAADTARIESADELRLAEGSVLWLAPRAPALIALPPRLAASLVVLTVGGKPADDEDGPLTEVDLAALDIWAAEALRDALARLGLDGAEVRRIAADPLGEAMQWPALATTVASAVGEAKLVVGLEALRAAMTPTGPRIGDDPHALLGVKVRAEARLAGADVSLTDLLTAGVGDVVVLGEIATQPVGLYVAGHEVASGRPGMRGSHAAVRIEHVEDLRLD
jgi:flagellar motor switch/type III secretory pathway protein FliN